MFINDAASRASPAPRRFTRVVASIATPMFILPRGAIAHDYLMPPPSAHCAALPPPSASQPVAVFGASAMLVCHAYFAAHDAVSARLTPHAFMSFYGRAYEGFMTLRRFDAILIAFHRVISRAQRV